MSEFINQVMDVITPGQFPIVPPSTLDEHAVFDPNRDIDGTTVTIYPPDVVIAKRIIDNGRHAICRFAGGPLCVISRKHLKLSEVKLS